MADALIYVSVSTTRSLWQEYRVFDDRVEFATLFGLMKIPLDEIEKVEISESEIRGLARGDLHLKGFRPALKLDWANFVEHVVLDKSGGRIHRILFTPDDLPAFKRALDGALAKHRERARAKQA